MAEVNGTDHLVRHEKESKLNGYDNEGFHCQERSEDEEESASDDDRLRVVVTENGHRPEDDPPVSNGYVHDEDNNHSTTVNGSAVIVIEDNKSDCKMNDNKESNCQKPLDTRLHHYVPVDDIDRKILNGSDGTHVTIPEDAVINFTTGRVKVKKGSSNNSQVSNERESIPLETMLPSYEAEDRIGLGEKAELEAELTNHKNGLWSEGHNTYNNAESPFGNSEKLNGTSKSSDEISLPVNNHRKCLSSDVSDTSSEQKSTGEKLYFTEENRKLCPGWRRMFVCGLILIIIAVALLLGVLAATGILLAESESKNSRYESGHSLPSSDFISQAGISLKPGSSSKVPQKSPAHEETNTTVDPISRTFSPTVSSKVPVLNDTSHSQTIVPNALVGEFTIDENFTDDLKDSNSSGYISLANYIERELRGIFKRNGGVFETVKILSFSPGSIKIKFVTVWASDNNVILSTKAEEVFKTYLRRKKSLLLAYPVHLDSIHFIDVFDECRVQKGGCQFSCMWDYKTLSKTCVCEENMVLLADGKSCGLKSLTSTETTTLNSINRTSSNISIITTEQTLQKETTKELDKTTLTTTMIPTIVTKAIISITELFHNLTSTAIPIPVIENTTNLQNLSPVSEYFTSDVQITTKAYNSETLTIIEESSTATSEKESEAATEIPTTIVSIVSRSTENTNILKESTTPEINAHFYSTSETSVVSKLETTTKPSFINNTNNTNDLPQQTTTISDTTDSQTETILNIPLTEHSITQEDVSTIGYHIKEETTEMYSLNDGKEFVTFPEFITTTEEPAISTTNLDITTNDFSTNEITESTYTSEMTQPPEIDMPKNASETIYFNVTDLPVIHTTEKTTTIEDIPTITMDSQEEAENVTYATELLNMTEILNEEVINETYTTFSLTDNILNETEFKDTHTVDSFMTTTLEPLITTSHSNRSPEVRSFDEDDENHTTIQTINFNSTESILNDTSPETSIQPDENETVFVLNSTTTLLPTTELPTETILTESTTEKSEIHETTTSFVEIENKFTINTQSDLIETTTITEMFTEKITEASVNTETTLNSELSATLTTEILLITKNVTDGIPDTTRETFENETTTIRPFEPDIHSEITEINNGTEAENKTSEIDAEISTTLLPDVSFENNTTYNSNVTETIENPLYENTPTTTSIDLITTSDILETTLLNSEISNHTNITNNSTNGENFNFSAMSNNTDDEFLLSITTQPTNISEELTTLQDSSTLEDLDLTSLETNNFSISNTEIPSDVTPILTSDSTETSTLATIPSYTLPMTVYPNESEIEVTTESVYDAEMFTFNGYNNETLFPFETNSSFTNTTDEPFESSFLELNSTLISGSNESLENSTFIDEFGNFTTEGYDAENETTTYASTGVECREDQFLCEPLNRCINDTFMCDGIEDCPDGRDEFECKDSCHSNFMCANSSTCIMSEARCDGIWDCENGTDEDNCTPTECAQHEVMCLDNSKCIKPGHICDWKYNCLDRSDEVGCVERTTCESSGRFFCNDGLCIPWSLKCDGEIDCKEGEDEGNCTCLNDEFRCSDGKCLKSSSRCDGHQDCHDADDEMGCVTVDSQQIISTYEPYSGSWGLLCAEDWNLDDGQYLCQELGFGHALNVERIHVSFNGTWMAMRRENLTESSLWTERVSFVESCTSGLAAAVECQKFVCGQYSGLLHRRKRDVISSSSNQWPFIGYISTFYTNRGCLAEILTPIWLITSADCLLSISKEPFNGSDWYVRTNLGREIEADLAQNHEVLKIINHPHSSKFRSLTLRDYDVALIRLKHALVFVSEKIGAICLPEEQVPPGITCFSGVLGTEKPRAPPPPVLTINSLALQITDRKNCNSVEHYNNALNQRMLCTQSSEGHTICDNDEGTPLMCLSGINKWFVAGMLTYQRFCDVYSKHPAVYSNLFSMRKFLDKVIGQKQYEVPYDSSVYVIIPPTTPSPTMPETTTPEITTLSTIEFELENTTYLTTAEFENETVTNLYNLEEINGTTEIDEELIREENYTSVLPEELIGRLINTTVNEDYWNETVTTPYSDVPNATTEVLEESVFENLTNKTHDSLISLLNDTYSMDDATNNNFTLATSTELINTTVSPILEITTASLKSTNIPEAFEINDSLITTNFMITDNATTIVITEQPLITTDVSARDATDATITTHSSLTSTVNDSKEYSKFTTISTDSTTLDDFPVYNNTVEMFKPINILTNDSKIISQPLIALTDDTETLESSTTMSSLETISSLENSTDDFITDAPLTETQNFTHNVDNNSETVLVSTANIVDYKENTTFETTTQSLDEIEAITFVVDGEPDSDQEFSLIKNPDGLKLESYRMLEDNYSIYSTEKSVPILTEQDINLNFTTESLVTLIPTTTIAPNFTNKTLEYDNVTNTFSTEPTYLTSDNIDYSMNFTSETHMKSGDLDVSILSPSDTTDDDLIFKNVTDESIRKSEDLVNNDQNYSNPLDYEDEVMFDVTNTSSFFTPNETESRDLVFYNLTEKTIPKSAGSVMDDMNYSVPLFFENDPKSNSENKSSTFFSNGTERHDLIFYNITENMHPNLTTIIKDNMNDSILSLEGESKSDITNVSIPYLNLNENRSSELNNFTNEFNSRAFDSNVKDMNYSVFLNSTDDIKIDSVNASFLSSDMLTENDDTKSVNKSDNFLLKLNDSITDDMNDSNPISLESDNIDALPLEYSRNITENHDFEINNESEDLGPQSRSLFKDDMNQSISLALEGNNRNITSYIVSPHSHNLTENYSLLIENITDKAIPKSVSSINGIINNSVPLLLDEKESSHIENESLIDDKRTSNTTSTSEPELDAESVEDPIMKIHLTSDELNVLPDNNTLSNETDCGVWSENSGAMNRSYNQNPFKLWPAIGYLRMITESKMCPSTVVSPRYVITSLNCLTSSNMDLNNLDLDKWSYIGGLENANSSNEIQTLAVDKIIPYPGNSILRNEHDAVLIRINDTIEINEYSKSACIPQKESKVGEECFTVGWNKNYSNEEIQSEFYSFPLKMISIEECNNTMNYNGILIDGLLCGVQVKENDENCYMEFGSPVFCLNERKHWELQGILNRPDPCNVPQPIIFSSISNIRKWINEILSDN